MNKLGEETTAAGSVFICIPERSMYNIDIIPSSVSYLLSVQIQYILNCV